MKGTVFQPLAEGMHPWFIISDERDGKVLAVNISDADKHPESTCFLFRDEHESVKKDSGVFYRQAMLMEVTKLKKDLKQYCTVFPDCPEEILKRIIAGALHEDSGLALKYRKYLE